MCTGLQRGISVQIFTPRNLYEKLGPAVLGLLLALQQFYKCMLIWVVALIHNSCR